MDILALALSGEPDRQPADEKCVQRARLRSVKAYIEANLCDPNLSLATIAKRNGISLRYLHQLFRLTDMSASDWLRFRRLQRCFDLLRRRDKAKLSITDIAFSMGFSSSSHFSNLFRAQFDLRPSDVRGDFLKPGVSRKTSLLTDGAARSPRSYRDAASALSLSAKGAAPGLTETPTRPRALLARQRTSSIPTPPARATRNPPRPFSVDRGSACWPDTGNRIG